MEGRRVGANRIFTILSLFIVVATSHFFSDVAISTDSHLTVPVAMSIIKEGDVDVDEYIEPLNLNSNIAKKFKGHYYNCFPLGPSLIAVPFVYVIDKVLPALTALPEIKNYLKRRSGSVSRDPDVVKLSAIVEVFIASIVVAMTAVLVYLIAALFTGKTYALVAAFVFAYCTSAWSTASRGLWQHGPSMLMLTIVLYLMLLAKKTPRIIQFAGLPLAFSYVIRPTNSISVILLSIFVLIQHREYFLKYAFWFLTIGVPFIATSLIWYGTILPYYHTELYSFSRSTVLEGLGGTLVSPSRGLFVFSPILLVSLWGAVWKLRTRPGHAPRRDHRDALDYFLLGIILLHWVVVSSVPKWWGGHSYGPRYFCDVIPYFIYFLIPGLESVRAVRGFSRAAAVSAFLVFLLLSFFVHFRGANCEVVYGWNSAAGGVDVHPYRLWDWSDAQFLRGISLR